MVKNKFEAFSGQLKRKEDNLEEEAIVVNSNKISEEKKIDGRLKKPEDKVKSKTIAMVPRVAKMLTQQRLKNAPLLSDSQYIQNLIWMDATGEPFFDSETKEILPGR